jgi:hypothetical protein
MTEKELAKVNVKIAKKMGWKKFRLERCPAPLDYEKRMTGIAPGNFRHQFVPSYTNNLAYAMHLVEWALEKEYEFKMNSIELTKGYEVVFMGPKGMVGTAFARRPQMAICLAFLDKRIK